MQRPILFLAAAMLLCPLAHAAAPALRMEPVPHQAVHSRHMVALAPSLRQWVVEEGRRSADAGPDAIAIDEAVRVRLAGQEYADADVDALVQLVLMECARDADEDLRAVMAEMKASNEQKRATREYARAAAQASQKQKAALRDSYEDRTQLQPQDAKLQAQTPSNLQPGTTATALDAELVQPAQEEKDSLSDMGEEKQLRLQMYQDRRQQAMEMLSNLMKKQSETASGITSNLK